MEGGSPRSSDGIDSNKQYHNSTQNNLCWVFGRNSMII